MISKAVLLLFILVCLTEGGKLMHKLDKVAARTDITKSGPHAIEQKTGNQTEMNCQFDNEYLTVKSACDYYVQKYQLAAFLLSLFLGMFGADWFYLARGDENYIVHGIFKLLMTLLGGSADGCVSMKISPKTQA